MNDGGTSGMRWDEIVYGQIALGMTNRTISDTPIFMISSIYYQYNAMTFFDMIKNFPIHILKCFNTFIILFTVVLI